MVGNFLSAAVGTRGVCEDLAARLAQVDWKVITTSRQQGRLNRLLDMIRVAWCDRSAYTVAQVDVFSGLAFIWAEVVCTILKMIDKPYILTLRGGNLPTFAGRFPGRVSRILRHAGAVTTPSHYLREAMQVYRADIQLLPNPLDLSRYPFRLRECLEPKLIWLRAFHEIYNPSLATRALAQLKNDFPESTLLMVGPDKGDGSYQATLKIADELGVRDHLFLPGSVAKAAVPEWLAKGDIFLNTTRYESFGVAVMEAAALGLNIVTTNVGELPYIWRDGHDALLVPPNDPEAMAAAVRRILTEPGLAARLSHNARKKAEQYDWSAVLPQWEELLQRVASEIS